MKNTCYMCYAPATGREHFPPRCIFPEDRKYRANLIKVPSCDEHNSKKSKCDEYLKFVLTAVGGMNELADVSLEEVLCGVLTIAPI